MGTPVVGGGADNACGAAGVGVVSAGEAVASWGTSGTVLSPTHKPKVDPSLRAHTFRHVLPDTWYGSWVITTSPPGSVHLVGAAVQRATGARWLADLRDSLVAHPHRRADTAATKAKERLRTSIARLVASRADAITCVSEAIAERETRWAGEDLYRC